MVLFPVSNLHKSVILPTDHAIETAIRKNRAAKQSVLKAKYRMVLFPVSNLHKSVNLPTDHAIKTAIRKNRTA